jgi:hypothetical protein
VLDLLWTSRMVCKLLLLSCVASISASAQQTAEEFHQSQIDNFYLGINDPGTRKKVDGIWFDLAQYSYEHYVVVAAQQFTAGQALPSGIILLDVSIAGDPHGDVTRFFLAHEWGHQHYGDPYKSLTLFGPYYLATTGTKTEDRADLYATAFMKKRGYDIDRPVEFFCSLPDAGPADTHSNGPTRAKNISSAYWGNAIPDDPCNPTWNSIDFNKKLKLFISEAPVAFESLRDHEIHNGMYLAATKFQNATSCTIQTVATRMSCYFRHGTSKDLKAKLRLALDPDKWPYNEDSSQFERAEDVPSNSVFINIRDSEANGGAYITIIPQN